jgi:hypothetical protein
MGCGVLSLVFVVAISGVVLWYILGFDLLQCDDVVIMK